MTDSIKRLTKLRYISVSEINFFRLKRLGNAGDSFNDVISELLEKHETDFCGCSEDVGHSTKSDYQIDGRRLP